MLFFYTHESFRATLTFTKESNIKKTSANDVLGWDREKHHPPPANSWIRPAENDYILSFNLDVFVGLPINDVVEEEPGLRPAQPYWHLHRHGLRPVVHLGHLQDP